MRARCAGMGLNVPLSGSSGAFARVMGPRTHMKIAQPMDKVQSDFHLAENRPTGDRLRRTFHLQYPAALPYPLR